MSMVNCPKGEVVPMPTLPLSNTINLDPVIPPTNKLDVAIKEFVVVVPDMSVFP